MTKNDKKPEMTLDRLAQTTQREFLVVRKDMAVMKEDIVTIKETMATKDDLKRFATKVDLNGLRKELKDDIRNGTVEVLRAVDVIVTRFDTVEKDHTADKLLHDRHEKRLETVETKLGLKSI